MHTEIIQGLAILGFIVSSYALYVEMMFRKNRKYIALCDISERISCSKPLKSKFSKILGLPNALWGLISYTVIFALAVLGYTHIVFLAAVAAAIFSFYLAYVLFFIVDSFCVVCMSIYLINILLLIISYLNLWNIH